MLGQNQISDTCAYVARIDLYSWDMDTPRCELGYIGDSRIGGQGLVREAAAAMLTTAWSMGVERVQALSYERDDEGALCDHVMFAILASRQP